MSSSVTGKRNARSVAGTAQREAALQVNGPDGTTLRDDNVRFLKLTRYIVQKNWKHLRYRVRKRYLNKTA